MMRLENGHEECSGGGAKCWSRWESLTRWMILEGSDHEDGVAIWRSSGAERCGAGLDGYEDGEDLKAKAEYDEAAREGSRAAAALDVAQRAHGKIHRCVDGSYHHFGEVMERPLQLLDDPMMKDKAIDEAYQRQ